MIRINRSAFDIKTPVIKNMVDLVEMIKDQEQLGKTTTGLLFLSAIGLLISYSFTNNPVWLEIYGLQITCLHMGLALSITTIINLYIAIARKKKLQNYVRYKTRDSVPEPDADVVYVKIDPLDFKIVSDDSIHKQNKDDQYSN